MKPDDWGYPEWDCAGKVHDWRNYATCELKDHWHNMTDITKQLVAACLQNIADDEEWE